LKDWQKFLIVSTSFKKFTLKNFQIFLSRPCENLPKKKKKTGYNPKSQAWCIGFFFKNSQFFGSQSLVNVFKILANFSNFPLKRNFPKVFVAKVQKVTQNRNIDSIAFPPTALKWPFNTFWTKNRSQIV